jgi:hypothetical protein
MFGLLVLALPLAYLAMTPLAAEEGSETRMVLLQLVGMLGLFGSVLLLAPGAVAVLGRLLLPMRLVAPMSAWLVGKVVSRSAGRVAAAVCGLSAVLLAVLGLKSVTGSLRAEVDVFAQQALDDRMFLRCTPATPAAVAKLATLPGVRRSRRSRGNNCGGGFLLRGLAVESAAGPGSCSKACPSCASLRRSKGAHAGGEPSARAASEPGTKAAGHVADRNGVRSRTRCCCQRPFAGFDMDERAFADHVAALDASGLLHRRGERGAHHAAARCRAPTRAALRRPRARCCLRCRRRRPARGSRLPAPRRRQGLRAVRPAVAADARAGRRRPAERHDHRRLGRSRELGVLRALGISRGALAGSFLLEGALVAILASLMSLLLALPMAWVLVRGMNRVAALDAPVTLPYTWFWVVPAAALLTGVLSAIVPARRSLRQSPSESVRYE